MNEYDEISHPSHYVEGRKYEPKDVIRMLNLNFNLGNAVKYLSRAGRKGDKLTDLKKAKQYLQFEADARRKYDNTITDYIDEVTLDCGLDSFEGHILELIFLAGNEKVVIENCIEYINDLINFEETKEE